MRVSSQTDILIKRGSEEDGDIADAKDKPMPTYIEGEKKGRRI